MKNSGFRFVLFLILSMVVSCDEPDTVVTNTVHSDGSVTRKIVIRNSKNKLDPSAVQVPFDSTWTITDSLEIGLKGDSVWVKTALKQFGNVAELNKSYQKDKAINHKIPRAAHFRKRFRWFNTEYRFSENVDKLNASAIPIKKYLNDTELAYFYSPDDIKYKKDHGPDSLKYKAITDSIDKKTISWLIRNVSSMWIEEFARQTGPAAGPELSATSLNAREEELEKMIYDNQNVFDSLWTNGILLRRFIGDSAAIRFKTQADSSASFVLSKLMPDFSNYSVRIVMPGKLTGTNGFIDSTRTLLWPVKSDFFVTDNYEMWAESKTPNLWAWFVSGLFLVFVIAGIIIKKKVPPVGRD